MMAKQAVHGAVTIPDSAARREILECVSSNRTLSDSALRFTKRKPFDLLAERPALRVGRGDWTRTSDLQTPSLAL
jgi:hypothetical protein